MFVFYCLFIAGAFFWASFQPGRPSPLYLSYHSKLHLPKDLLLGLIPALLIVLFSSVLSIKSRWAKALEREFQKLLCPLNLSAIAWISCWSSLGEEFLFRGAMQPALGLIPTSLIFGLFHFPVRKVFLPWTFFSTLVGFVLGLLFQVTENLLAPVICHFTINFLNLCLIQTKYDKDKEQVHKERFGEA